MNFYDKYDNTIFNTNSAEFVIPLLLQILDTQKIESVIDFGCGIGTWLNTFKKNGVQKVKGLDGAHVDKNQLLIDFEQEFKVTDLSQFVTDGTERYDLAMSLEVAEHIDDEYADQFIKNLTSYSDTVLFSAAIPGQMGYHHVNCQWPSYWVGIFKSYGYEVIDCLRPILMRNPDIEYWYRQNILIFTKDTSLLEKYSNDTGKYMELISKEVYQSKYDELTRIKNGTLGIKWAYRLLLKSIRIRLNK